MGKIFIVDGNSLLFRSFYALYRPGMDIMRASNGTPTNAIYSFNNMMKKIKSELKGREWSSVSILERRLLEVLNSSHIR